MTLHDLSNVLGVAVVSLALLAIVMLRMTHPQVRYYVHNETKEVIRLQGDGDSLDSAERALRADYLRCDEGEYRRQRLRRGIA